MVWGFCSWFETKLVDHLIPVIGSYKIFCEIAASKYHIWPYCVVVTAELLYRLVDFHVDCDPLKLDSHIIWQNLFFPSVTYFIDLALQEQRQYFLKRINEWTFLDY